MAHKFDPHNKSRLHTSERLAAMPPGETLINLGLQKDDIFADVGCGTGYFTEAAAAILDNMSNIYALDTSMEMLEYLQERLEKPTVNRLNIVQTAEYDFIIPNDTATFCLLSFVLHEVDDKLRMLQEGKRILKPGGVLAVIEWEKKPTQHGPPLEHRLEKSDVVDLLVQAGLEKKQSSSIGTDYYAVSGIRPHNF